MFGIVHLIVSLFGKGAASISHQIEDDKRRTEAYNQGEHTYYYRGTLRYTTNGRDVCTVKDWETGHELLKDLKNGRVYRDYTQEKIDRENAEARSKGKTVKSYYNEYYTYRQKKNNLWFKVGVYPEYIDIETGKVLLSICINHTGFYLDLDTGYVIRIADDPGKEAMTDKKQIERVIHIFNERQKKLRNDSDFMEGIWYKIKEEYFLQYSCVIIDDDGNVTLY